MGNRLVSKTEKAHSGSGDSSSPSPSPSASFSGEEFKWFSKRSGWLQKKGLGTLYRPWKRRLFVLDMDHTLTYYAGSSSSSSSSGSSRLLLKGCLKLHGAAVRHVVSAQADGRECAFEIFNLHLSNSNIRRGTTLKLQAETQTEAREWVEALGLCFASSERIRSGMDSRYESFRTIASGQQTGSPKAIVVLTKPLEEDTTRSWSPVLGQGQDQGQDQGHESSVR